MYVNGGRRGRMLAGNSDLCCTGVNWVDELALSDNGTAKGWFRDIHLDRFLQSISDDVLHPPLLPAEQPSELCLTDLGFDDFRRLEPGTHGRT